MIINPYVYAAAAGPTPSAIPNIWEWWEPSREAYADNDPISTLTGQFAGKNFTGTGSERPTFKAAVLNGLGVAQSLSSKMTGPDASAITTAGHIFQIIKATNDPGSGGGWTPSQFGTDPSPDLWPFSDGKVYMGGGSTTRYATGVDPVPSLAAWRCCELVSTGSQYIVLLDGSTLNTRGSNTVAFANPLYLFGNGISSFFTGQSAGWYIFSAQITGADRAAMVTYLNSRFGLSIS